MLKINWQPQTSKAGRRRRRRRKRIDTLSAQTHKMKALLKG
jgi:hypothetical protein